MKHFYRAYLRPFPMSKRLMSLYLVNIQPTSKLHPHHQNFLDPLLVIIKGSVRACVTIVGFDTSDEFKNH